MNAFWENYDFWKDTVRAVLLAGALCGYLGVFVVLRRVVFVGAALTQISAVGVALAFYTAAVVGVPDVHEHHPWWLSPQLWALCAAVLGALLFSLVRASKRLAPEMVVGLGWIIASALFLLIMASKRVGQEAHEVEDILYGKLIVDFTEVKTLALALAAVLAVHLAFYKEFLFVTFDGEMARTLGYRTALWDALLYVTFGVGISFAMRTVGALSVFGFLVIPSSAALLLVKRVKWAFPLAVLFGMAGGGLGYYFAWTREFPTGASIVMSCALFLVPGMLRRVMGRLS